MAELARWQNFYVIAGSSAGALIGLQFVVLSLISDNARSRSDAAAGNAFATPTIVHFGAVLGLAGILVAPWDGLGVVTALWGLVGLNGVAYSLQVLRRMRAQSAYRPQLEDWLFHVVLPLVAYAALAVSAAAARVRLREALFAVGAAVAVLLFVGIHNAWDAVTYHVFVKRGGGT
jgi:hypothetical protein